MYIKRGIFLIEFYQPHRDNYPTKKQPSVNLDETNPRSFLIEKPVHFINLRIFSPQ